ncbi:MAG TPA: L-seryl-tRNA(Sec) selenium transferase [Solirubrobacteraceae bacterium]|nr:L-seryl-tRNA(Sec) selenium transferase [Solirubrobacteraceae bacterium]
MTAGGAEDRLRALPQVERLGAEVGSVSAARAAIEQRRAELLAGATDEVDLAARARERLRPAPRRVLNATGVIVHTNLGRAPLAAAAREAVARVAEGYSDLELDVGAGERGSRHAHVEGLLCELTGAEAAMTVNNCAAAVLLAVAALGREVIVSRGQLVEIGGAFRVPEVVEQAGARLVEVGTTNRTRLRDYVEASGDVILRAHPSNFRVLGFTEEVAIEELCSLGLPVIDDVGSGVLADGVELLAEEPSVRRSVRAGAAVVCFSGDKLLGGPQAGVMVGTRDAIAACRRHPLARAVRIDKLCLAALNATLALYREPERALREIPVLRMLLDDPSARAERLAELTGGEVVQATAKVGGGALPLLELPGPVVALKGPPEALAARLRAADPPVIGRIQDGRLLLDPRTLADDEVELVACALR